MGKLLEQLKQAQARAQLDEMPQTNENSTAMFMLSEELRQTKAVLAQIQERYEAMVAEAESARANLVAAERERQSAVDQLAAMGETVEGIRAAADARVSAALSQAAQAAQRPDPPPVVTDGRDEDFAALRASYAALQAEMEKIGAGMKAVPSPSPPAAIPDFEIEPVEFKNNRIAKVRVRAVTTH